LNNEIKREIEIKSEIALIRVRRILRKITETMGFRTTDITRIITAASELVRNVVIYAENGIMSWDILTYNDKKAIKLIFKDNGPGIPDIEKAMEPGFSTGKGQGMGLSGVKRLMDEMEIISEVGKGTTVIIKKWLKS
jgi:serine/threonine-protein kinase RsbT